MYTEFHFNSSLKRDTPDNVIHILEYMADIDADEPETLPNHDFFDCDRWRSLFTMDSYYFDADTHSTIRFDDIANRHYLCVRSNIKNYHEEIQKFIDFIKPYLDKYKGDFLGFYRYEESDKPELIYM